MGFKGKYLFSNKEDTINMKFSDLRYEDKNLVIEKKGKGKFFNDELFFINENKLFILDGTILNNSELISESNEETWEKTYLKLYKEDSQNFLSKLRGNFVGIIYDIKNKKLTLFTDQLKNKNIYYTITDDNFIFSTNPEDIFSSSKIPIPLSKLLKIHSFFKSLVICLGIFSSNSLVCEKVILTILS